MDYHVGSPSARTTSHRHGGHGWLIIRITDGWNGKGLSGPSQHTRILLEGMYFQ